MRSISMLLCVCVLVSPSFARASVTDAEAALARQDYSAARMALEEPARLGDTAAQDMLGHMLLFGRGGPIDAKQAEILLQDAANKGSSEAQNSMGVIFMTGITGKVDPVQGLMWFEKAANGGHSYAMFNLGRAAEQGLGRIRSLPDAERWYRRAAESGNEVARERLAQGGLTAQQPLPSLARTEFMQQAQASAPVVELAVAPVVEAETAPADTSPSLTYALDAGSQPGLRIASPRLALVKGVPTLHFTMFNNGPKATGTLVCWLQGQDGRRTALALGGATPSFSLSRQVRKQYTVPRELLSNGGILIIEARVQGIDPTVNPVEAQLAVAAP